MINDSLEDLLREIRRDEIEMTLEDFLRELLHKLKKIIFFKTKPIELIMNTDG